MIINEANRISLTGKSFFNSVAVGDFVDHEAHIGGAVFGCMCALLLRSVS